MSKKQVGAEAHMDSVSRLIDGWGFAVTLTTGLTLYFNDHDYLDAVVARWRSTEDSPILRFSGAREIEGGPVVGRGAILASQVVAIAEGLPDEESDEDEYEGDEDEEDLLDETDALREQFRPVASISAPAPAPAPIAPVTVSDEDLEGEVKTGP